MKNFLTFFTFIFLISNPVLADIPYVIDISKILNESKAGAEAQKKLKNRFTAAGKKFSERETSLKKQEKEIIAQKKLITKEEYKKKVDELRKKVATLQKNKQETLNNIAKSRNNAKTELLKTLNPIVKKYMEDNNIRLVLKKNSIVLGDNNLDITPKIIAILNNELKSLKID